MMSRTSLPQYGPHRRIITNSERSLILLHIMTWKRQLLSCNLSMARTKGEGCFSLGNCLSAQIITLTKAHLLCGPPYFKTRFCIYTKPVICSKDHKVYAVWVAFMHKQFILTYLQTALCNSLAFVCFRWYTFWALSLNLFYLKIGLDIGRIFCKIFYEFSLSLPIHVGHQKCIPIYTIKSTDWFKERFFKKQMI